VAVAISDLAPSFSADHGEETVAGGTSLCRQSRLGSGGGQPLHARRLARSGWHSAASPVQSPGSHPHRCCSQGQLQAHAWVESQGRIVSGGLKDLWRYTPLPLLEGKYNERDRWHLPLDNRTVDSADLNMIDILAHRGQMAQIYGALDLSV